MSEAGRVSVVIVDDHAMFRRGVRAELGDAVEVLAEAADVDEAIAAIAAHHPDVVRLARAQERELRGWLYRDPGKEAGQLSERIKAAAAEVEDALGQAVEVVSVGDCDLGEPLRPVVAATREAVTNAAKHAGTGQIDVYAEITTAAVDVFVRDRGRGFDLADVPDDRHGVRHSIIDRMERHGGTAEIRSAPGEGTEVRLHLPRQENPDG